MDTMNTMERILIACGCCLLFGSKHFATEILCKSRKKHTCIERIKQTELKHEQKHHLELWQSDFIGNKIITCWRELNRLANDERDLKGLYISRQVSFDMETCKTSGQNRQDAFKSITSTQIADQIDLNVYSMSVWCCHS